MKIVNISSEYLKEPVVIVSQIDKSPLKISAKNI